MKKVKTSTLANWSDEPWELKGARTRSISFWAEQESELESDFSYKSTEATTVISPPQKPPMVSMPQESVKKPSSDFLSHYEFAKKLATQDGFIFGRRGNQLYKYSTAAGFFRLLEGILLFQELKMPIAENLREQLTSRKIQEIKLDLLTYPEFHIVLEENTARQERYINFSNGVLDLKKHRLLQHHPQFQFTSVIDVGYDEESDKELPESVQQFFDAITAGDDELLRKIRMMFGLAISNIRSAKVGFFIIGKANTGKSTLIALLRQIVGEENASALSLSDLAKDFRLEQAADKKLNTISELAQSDLKHLDILKTVIGNRVDKITAERKFERPFSFIPTFLLVAAGNDLPKIPKGHDPDSALRKRLYIVQLNTSIPKEKQQANVLEKLSQYKSEIVHWAMEGVWDYLDNGLPPNIRYEEIAPDDESDDGFERFVDMYCVVEAGAWLASKELMSIYNEFCDKEGIAEIYRASANRMAIILKGIPGVSKAKRANREDRCGRGYDGIKFKEIF